MPKKMIYECICIFTLHPSCAVFVAHEKSQENLANQVNVKKCAQLFLDCWKFIDSLRSTYLNYDLIQNLTSLPIAHVIQGADLIFSTNRTRLIHWIVEMVFFSISFHINSTLIKESMFWTNELVWDDVQALVTNIPDRTYHFKIDKIFDNEEILIFNNRGKFATKWIFLYI